jgi:hypothetical protein
MDKSIPFKRPFLPFIYEVDGRNAKEQHHRPKAEMADLYFLSPVHNNWQCAAPRCTAI